MRYETQRNTAFIFCYLLKWCAKHSVFFIRTDILISPYRSYRVSDKTKRHENVDILMTWHWKSTKWVNPHWITILHGSPRRHRSFYWTSREYRWNVTTHGIGSPARLPHRRWRRRRWCALVLYGVRWRVMACSGLGWCLAPTHLCLNLLNWLSRLLWHLLLPLIFVARELVHTFSFMFKEWINLFP